MPDGMIQLTNIVKKFDDYVVVNNLSVNIQRGEFLTLLGPSGCGKTTVLRMIAGFEQPDSGNILLDGENVVNKQPFERNINMVFQNYALFPHMNVFDNIAFGLRMKKAPRETIKEKVAEVLRLVQLEGYGKRNPEQLSGGQKQRIAIARALVNSPKVLLLDEPLGALDLQLRKQMQLELKHLQRQLDITFIYVTHDQEEALTMSDRIAVMNQGNLEQLGSPVEIYDRPRTKFVAGFIGEANLFEGCILHTDNHAAVMEIGGQKVPVKNRDLKNGDNVWITVRPERMKLSILPKEGSASLQGSYKERIYAGALLKTIIVLDSGKEIVISESALSPFRFDDDEAKVFVNWDIDDAVVIMS